MDKDLLKKFAKYSSMPFEFFVMIGGGAYLGNWLDKKFETGYALTIILAILGFSAALYHIFKSIKKE